MSSTRRTSGALPAEAARWLAVDLGSRPAQVVVAGATGGAGATTLTALVARCLASYRAPTRPRPSVAVLDHDGGTVHERSGAPVVGGLAARAAQGETEGGVSFSPRAAAPSPSGLVTPEPVDADVLLRCLGAQALNPEPTLLDDPTVVAVVVVPVDVTRARTGGAVLGLPWDHALAAPGEITERALAPATRRAVLAVTAEVLAAARRVAVVTAG